MLFPFQKRGAEWLSPRRVALLADEMGLGKSAQAITACDLAFADKVLVICPAIARTNWSREFAKFSLYTRNFWTCLSEKVPPPVGRSIICSYDLATHYFRKGMWKDHHFDVAILDEAHFLKSHQAYRTNAILGVSGVSRQADQLWALTGTPYPNHPGELWVLLTTFGRVAVSYDAFIAEYCEFAPGFRDYLRIVGAKKDKIPALGGLLSPVMLRRTVGEVLPDLPPLHFGDMTVEPGLVEFTPEMREKVDEEEQWLLEQLPAVGGNLTPDHMGILEALAGSVSTLRLYNGLQKVDPVAELVGMELKEGAYPKVVIFGVHRDVVNQLQRKLSKWGAVSIHGATSQKARQANIDSFQNDPNCRVIVCNIKAAGTAITLTASTQVVFAEYEWCPGDNMQAAKRAHRIGQKHPVLARMISIADSIDEKVARVVRRKTSDINALFDATSR